MSSDVNLQPLPQTNFERKALLKFCSVYSSLLALSCDSLAVKGSTGLVALEVSF